MARNTKLVEFISKMVDEVTQGQLTSDEAAEKIQEFIETERQKEIEKITGEVLPFTL